MNLVIHISHTEDHHPEITLGYNSVCVKYFTYAIDGLSENDFICAAKIDKNYINLNNFALIKCMRDSLVIQKAYFSIKR